MELQSQNKSVSITTNETQNLVSSLYHINYVINYPLSDMMLEGWERSIKELEPEITSDVIKWILDNVKIGLIEWDNRKGIQNIFEGFREYIKSKTAENKTGHLDKWNDLYRKYNNNKTYHDLSGIA